jgi:hypothetical protein
MSRVVSSPARPQQLVAARWSEARLVTFFIVGLIVWLPLQTPFAIALYQYSGLSVGAVRSVVLAKDVVSLVTVVVLLARHRGSIRIQWFDWLAVAFVALLGVYAVVPLLSGNGPSLNATVAGLRQFGLPIELYVLGRLAAMSGVRFEPVLRVFLVVAVAAALFTVLLYALAPVTFWTSTLDLVGYVREVQGLPGALSLWDISVLGTYGQSTAEPIARAIGPFTHPVGTAAYFVLPFAFASAAALAGRVGRRHGVWLGAAVLFLTAIIFTISRGGWIAAGLAILLLGVALRRTRIALVVLLMVGLFVWFVPPFSVSLHSAVNGTDGSAILHQQAVENGVENVTQNPFGSGVGRSDLQFGQTFGGGAGEGALLENTYLSVFVATGPLGLIAIIGWIAGVVLTLWPSRARLRFHWPRIAMIAAILGLAFTSLTSNTLMRFTTGASFWILVGLLIGHVSRSHRSLALPWRDRARARESPKMPSAASPDAR